MGQPVSRNLAASSRSTDLRPWPLRSPVPGSTPLSSVRQLRLELSMNVAARGMRSRCSFRSLMSAGQRERSISMVVGGCHGSLGQSAGTRSCVRGGVWINCEGRWTGSEGSEVCGANHKFRGEP